MEKERLIWNERLGMDVPEHCEFNWSVLKEDDLPLIKSVISYIIRRDNLLL
jgi:hypothetical protein